LLVDVIGIYFRIYGHFEIKLVNKYENFYFDIMRY
jgi:hypothetical protein